MSDAYTQEGNGWTVRHTCRWEVWKGTRPDAEKALHAHKQKCRHNTGDA